MDIRRAEHSVPADHKVYKQKPRTAATVRGGDCYVQKERPEAVYHCHHPKEERPLECRHAEFLLFKFEYSASKRLSPYGEIAYNYARICLNSTAVEEGEWAEL